MNLKNITVPITLVTDHNVASAAKVIYLVLKTFPKDKSAADEFAVVAAHKELIQKSGLSHKTVVKALSNLEAAGWIEQRQNSGHPNKYILTAPS